MKAIFAALLMLICMNSRAQDETSVRNWNEATRSYGAHQYRNAIEHYEEILKTHKASAAVYYNLGNAYYKNGDAGKAVLNYKRALKLDATDAHARENIAFIQARTPGAPVALKEIFFLSAYRSVLHTVPANTWAILSLAGFLVILYIIYRISTGSIRYGYRWLSFGAVMWLLVLSFAFSGYRQGSSLTEGVVITDQAFIYESGDSSRTKLSVPEGTVVTFLGSTKDSKVLIRLNNGSEGWIDRSDIEIV